MIGAVERQIGRRYAQAFLNVNSKEERRALLKKIEKLQRYLQQHSELLRFFLLPLFSLDMKMRWFDSLVRHFSLPSTFQKLGHHLIMKERMKLFIFIVEEIERIAAKESHVEVFELRSSHPLSPEHLETIKAFVEKKRGHPIQLHHSIDPTLIAGIRLQSDSAVWEYSVEKRLRALRRALLY